MERVAIVENDEIVNVVNAPANWVDPKERELVSAPRGAGVEIGALRQSNGSWKMPEPLVEEMSKSIRAKRDRLLANSDWVTIRATDTGTAVPTEWQTYRQALRDITEQTGFPENIDWPEKPE